ncbi:MAG: isopeptide-forming domain-containing fimbrial protein, partial [Clostridiales bacterium]|nr:isopeptide-forming domain-containing fimbrial protein [Clostridiales bacterium]
YDGEPGGGGEKKLKESDFAKDAKSNYYVPGGEMDYTIRMTVPENIEEVGVHTITIYDDYDEDTTSYKAMSAVLKVGGTSLLLSQYSITNNPIDGLIRVTISDAGYSFVGIGGKILELTLTFLIDEDATGTIHNEAWVMYGEYKGGEDEEDVTLSDFSKDADSEAYTAGRDLGYTISVTLPEDVDKMDVITITDSYPATLTNASVVSLTIGTETLLAGAYSVSTTAGELTVTIDRTATGGYDFSNDAGKKLALTLKFTVAAGAKGEISNRANIEYDGIPGGEGEEKVKESDFDKKADAGTYQNGMEIGYTISVTLPDNIAERQEIKIVDAYEANNVSYIAGSAILKIGSETLRAGTDYSLSVEGSGSITVTILNEDYPFESLGGKALELKLRFLASASVTGAITNTAWIEYDGRFGGSDTATVVRYVPGGDGGVGPGFPSTPSDPGITIPSTPTPETPYTPPPQPPTYEVVDEVPPLGNLPKTGDSGMRGYDLILLGLMGMLGFLVTRKKEEYLSPARLLKQAKWNS